MISTYKLLLELCSKIQDYELKVCIVYQLTGSAFCAFLLDLEVREEGLLCPGSIRQLLPQHLCPVR